MSDKPIALGPRLRAIASNVPAGAVLGDIGTDHAYLPVWLIRQKIISKAIGVDIHQGPYLAARETVQKYGLADRIAIRLGDGLKPLKAGEVDTLVIAGMGGRTILKILDESPAVVREVATLILQPQGAESQVRQKLLAEGWRMQKENLVQEEGRIYTVICFSRQTGQVSFDLRDIEAQTDLLAAKISALVSSPGEIPGSSAGLENSVEIIKKYIWQLGPVILQEETENKELLLSLIRSSLENLRRITAEMAKTDRAQVKLKAQRLEQEIRCLEGIRKWLYR